MDERSLVKLICFLMDRANITEVRLTTEDLANLPQGGIESTYDIATDTVSIRRT